MKLPWRAGSGRISLAKIENCEGSSAYLVRTTTATAWYPREFRRMQYAEDCLIVFGRDASMGYGPGSLSKPARAHPS
jgi:hypothetical protein